MEIEVKKMREFLLWLRVLHPRFWVQNYPINHVWDAKLRSLLKTETFVKENLCICKIGPHLVWVENYPYASFRPIGLAVMPTRRTRIMAHDKLVKDLLKEG